MLDTSEKNNALIYDEKSKRLKNYTAPKLVPLLTDNRIVSGSHMARIPEASGGQLLSGS